MECRVQPDKAALPLRLLSLAGRGTCFLSTNRPRSSKAREPLAVAGSCPKALVCVPSGRGPGP